MSQRGNKLLEEVLNLSVADRQLLVQEVLASIDHTAFKTELKRRRDEYLADESCTVPWTDIFNAEEVG